MNGHRPLAGDGTIDPVPHVEFRLPARQRVYWLVVGVLWLPVGGLRLGAGDLVGAPAALVVAAGFAAFFALAGRYGLTLTPRHVIVRGLRRRVVGWGEVRDVTAADFLGSRRVALHLADGSTAHPWAPLHSWAQPDPEFDSKFHMVYEWWLAARAAAPVPPAAYQPMPVAGPVAGPAGR